MNTVRIGHHVLGEGLPCYFVAEIGSNFDGDLKRAKYLASLAKECGAQAAKFQSFVPEKIIRAEGFENRSGFQAKWSKSVWEVYRDASLPREWHDELCQYCAEIGIDFFSSPYDEEAIKLLNELGVPAHKVGSGEVTNHAFLRQIAQSGLPVILGTGASTLTEVAQAVAIISEYGSGEIILLQCVTNYPSTFESADLRAMVTMGRALDVPYGYSDHTPRHVVPMGAVALGACMVEKHFTDDTTREGPDHSFALDADAFHSMVTEIRELEAALGSNSKRITDEEVGPRVAQRRGLWVVRNIEAGQIITKDDIAVLRPATGLEPSHLDLIIGLRAVRDATAGTPLTWDVVKDA